MDETLSRLITAFHILHQQQLLDEHGHVSVRNPHDPSTFFTSNVPAILVSSKNDLNQWNVADRSPVTVPYNGCEPIQEVLEFSEHFLHSCIYDHYPGVQSVVHSHNLSTIVYGLCDNKGSMLQPSYQMAGFLGVPSPIFDAAHHYPGLDPSTPHNLFSTTNGLVIRWPGLLGAPVGETGQPCYPSTTQFFNVAMASSPGRLISRMQSGEPSTYVEMPISRQ